MATIPIFSTKSTCTFLWKIVNYNYLWMKESEGLESPEFEVKQLENTSWKMGLYPRGYQTADDIGFFLQRIEKLEMSTHNFNDIDLYFELAFLSENGSIYFSLQSEKFSLQQPSVSWNLNPSWYPFANLNKRYGPLPLNTLIAQCKIWRCDGKAAEDRFYVANTHIKVNQIAFQWQIKNFSTIGYNEKKTLEIKPNIKDTTMFQMKNLTFFIDDYLAFDLYLTGGQSGEEVIDIDIRVPLNKAKYFYFKTYLLDTSGSLQNSGAREFLFNNSENKGTLTLLFPKKQLMLEEKYLNHDVLTLVCDCTYSKEIYCEMIDFGTASIPLFASLVQNEHGLLTNDTVNLREDIGSLCSRDILSDMKLRTTTKTIPVHTQILGARSPVFRTMFASDMKETREGFIDVTDLDDDSVNRMLLYLYTDKLEDLQWEDASRLYAAADKYDIASLKSKCGAILFAKRSPTNACQILTLADMHQDEVLKNAVQDYILKQGKTIFSSEEWKVFMKTQLQLAAEIMYVHCNKN